MKKVILKKGMKVINERKVLMKGTEGINVKVDVKSRCALSSCNSFFRTRNRGKLSYQPEHIITTPKECN